MSHPERVETGSHLPDPRSFDIRRDMRLYLEHPPVHAGSAAAPIRGNLSISGWAMAREGIAAIEVALDGRIMMEAHRGIHRRDVYQAYPDWPEAASSGFAISIPQRQLPEGSHLVGLQIRDNAGQIGAYEFRISVDKSAGESGLLPLRKKISQAEVDMQVQRLKELEWRPSFVFVMALPGDGKDIEAAKVTLASLRGQAYTDWRLLLLTPGRKARPKNLPAWCADGIEKNQPRKLGAAARQSSWRRASRRAPEGRRRHLFHPDFTRR